jgi:limonene-1,2-epoxide hydrolase
MYQYDHEPYACDSAFLDPSASRNIVPTNELVTLFKQSFARLDPKTELPMARLYDPNVVFEDPFHKVHGREALTACFKKLNSNVEYATFEFTNEIVTCNSAVLTWVMTLRTLFPKQTIVVPGVSMLNFTNRIISHHDYFDVGAMMYERLPLLGRLLRWIKKKAM